MLKFGIKFQNDIFRNFLDFFIEKLKTLEVVIKCIVLIVGF